MKRTLVEAIVCFGTKIWDTVTYEYPESELDPEGAALDQALADLEGQGVAHVSVFCVQEVEPLDEMLETLLDEKLPAGSFAERR